MLRAALISVTVLLAMLPVLIFLVGFFSGGYYFSQRRRKLASESDSFAEDEPPSNPTTEAQEGVAVDVKKNVAYMDLDPE